MLNKIHQHVSHKMHNLTSLNRKYDQAILFLIQNLYCEMSLWYEMWNKVENNQENFIGAKFEMN